MKRGSRACSVTIELALIAACVKAEPPTLAYLKPLPGGPDAVAYAISGDGKVVAGFSGQYETPRTQPQLPVVWNQSVDAVELNLPDGATHAIGVDLNFDGSAVLVLGYSKLSTPNFRAFLWRVDSGFQWLGMSPGETGGAYPYAMSADGSSIVGECMIGNNASQRGFWWTNGAEMSPSLLLQHATSSHYYGISRNGRVAVGASEPCLSSCNHAIAATADEIVDLGTLPGGSRCVALDANQDGSVIVGYGDREGRMRSFRWTAETGIADLGEPVSPLWPGFHFDVYACATDASGSVIVGQLVGPTGSRAFIWTASLGIVDLNNYLSAMGIARGDGTLIDARGVSDDGRTITGISSNGSTRGFLVTLPNYCAGDLNFDGVVDDADFSEFVSTLYVYCDPWWNEGLCRADLNFDGVNTDEDIGLFLVSYDRLLCN